MPLLCKCFSDLLPLTLYAVRSLSQTRCRTLLCTCWKQNRKYFRIFMFLRPRTDCNYNWHNAVDREITMVTASKNMLCCCQCRQQQSVQHVIHINSLFVPNRFSVGTPETLAHTAVCLRVSCANSPPPSLCEGGAALANRTSVNG